MRDSVGLLDLPVPLMLDHLLPLLSNADLAALARVSRRARMLTADEMVWKRKTVADFKFPPHATARVGGWQNLYRGLSDPAVYIWGEVANGRLGMQYEELPSAVRRDVALAGGMPYPYKIPTTGGGLTRALGHRDTGSLVEIVAGGWSFHARTSRGKVWVWGTMNPETFGALDGCAISPNDVILTPELLQPLPPIRALSSGRSHTVALSDAGDVLEWRTWGLVWQLDLDLRASVVQLEAGWSFSTVLTDQADVYVWYSDWSTDAWTQTHDPDSAAAELVQPLHVSPLRLPPLPPSEPARTVTQIAAGEDFVIALADDGSLHRLDLHLPPASAQDWAFVQQLRLQRGLEDHDVTNDDFRAALHRLRMAHFLTHTAQWQPLPSFSHPQSLPAFQPQWVPQQATLGPIAHISAHFKHFVAFLPIVTAHSEEEDTVVLLGTSDGVDPVLVPEIQARGVIKLSMGDWHYGALTQHGELLTWGQFSKGALGNWAPGAAVQPESTSDAGWSNLIPLPRIFGRGPTAPRVGHPAHNMPALPGSRAAQHRAQTAPHPSKDNVAQPTLIHIDADRSLFAYDIAFAGWQSSALVMHIP